MWIYIHLFIFFTRLGALGSVAEQGQQIPGVFSNSGVTAWTSQQFIAGGQTGKRIHTRCYLGFQFASGVLFSKQAQNNCLMHRMW